jgi:hypothetical protein
MSERRQDGGSVYPGQWIDSLPTTGEQVVRDQWEGMSVRDYFAGQALAGLCTAGSFGPDEVAERSYWIADAMLKARNA